MFNNGPFFPFSPEDQQWYRAIVLAYPSEKCVCVGYLDFGNSEEVDLNQLRPISTPLLALPVQAMPCGLAGIFSAAQQVTLVYTSMSQDLQIYPKQFDLYARKYDTGTCLPAQTCIILV